MRNYQPQKSNPYKLPHNLYMQMLYLVRDYDRMKTSSGFYTELAAIDHALRSIPNEYQQGVWNNVCYRTPYPTDAGEATYKRWRCRFIYNLAKKLHKI